jgi:hypothetical protein
MAHFMRVMMFGLISWLVPYGVSLVFMGADGFVHGDYAFYRTVMLITVMLTTAVLLIAHFRSINHGFLREGVLVGLLWLEINLVLDLLFILPYTGMGAISQLAQAGINYVAIALLGFVTGCIFWWRDRRVKLANIKAAMRRREQQAAKHPAPPQRPAQRVPRMDIVRAPQAVHQSNVLRFRPAAQPAGFGASPRGSDPGTAPHVAQSSGQVQSTPVVQFPIRQIPRQPLLHVEPIIRAPAEHRMQAYMGFVQRLAELSPQKPVPPRRFPVRYSNLP